jgi:hypothetical protein
MSVRLTPNQKSAMRQLVHDSGLRFEGTVHLAALKLYAGLLRLEDTGHSIIAVNDETGEETTLRVRTVPKQQTAPSWDDE